VTGVQKCALPIYLAVDPSRRIAYIGMNAGTNDSFGEVVLVIVHLP